MDSTIQEMMEDKSMSFKFLLAVQQHKYEEAYQIGKEILKANPSDKSVNRFIHTLKFYVDGLFDFEEEEEEEEEFECEEEEAEEDELDNADEQEEEEEEYEEYEEGDQIQQEDDSEYEWVYEDEEVAEGFDEGENTDEEKNFVQEDTNEGDISLSMDKKIYEKKQTQQQQQQQSSKRVVQQIKPKSSIPNGIPTLPKIQNKQRPNSQSKQQIQKPQPLQQNLIKQAAVNQLRFPSSMAKKK
ncbi:unnamed protein product [Paramecium pentaurelia]|uniref:Uncharacterized protein n=1 Tax=Paramecium pentaurelia TaxID=43138 RepID=A0A8S1WBH0_9CILI|nr:unnamed protein product [Paramecium pentaurelia]